MDIYSKMSLLYYNDERARQVIRSGRLVMPYYSFRGQEAIPSALCTQLRDAKCRLVWTNLGFSPRNRLYFVHRPSCLCVRRGLCGVTTKVLREQCREH